MLKWILGFLLGCCSIFWLPQTLSVNMWIATAFVLIIGLVIAGKVHSSIISALNLSVIGFCMGLLWLNLHSELRLKHQIVEPLPESRIIKAKLVSIPQVYSQLLQFKVEVVASENQAQSNIKLEDQKLKMSWYRYQEDFDYDDLPRLGEVWQFETKIKPITAALNIEGYDAEKQAFIEGLVGKGSIKKGTAKRLIETEPFSIDYLRQSLHESLSSFENAGILQALLVGEKSGIDLEQRQKIQALGISHLLAISGLHISIIAGLAFWIGNRAVALINRIGLSITPVYGAAVISLLAALFYSALAGFSIATVRALIMWAVFVVTLISANNRSLIRSLAIALIIILVIDPISVLSFGFWLTFIAIAIIGAVLSGRVLFASKIWLAIKTQWYVSVGMALVVAFLFQQVSALAFVVNLILIPLFSFLVLPMVFIAVLILLLFKSSLLLSLLDKAFSLFFDLVDIQFLQEQSLFLQTAINDWAFLLLVLGYLLYLLPVGRLKILPASVFVLLAILTWLKPYKSPDYKLVIFDVGHGLANLVYNHEIAILYDTAFANDGFSYAETTLIPSLRKLGIHKLDALIVSHDDMDHSGGLKALLKAFEIDLLINSKKCNKYPTLSFNDLQIELYSAFGATKDVKSNNRSCVTKIITGNHTALFTGDIEKQAELALLKQGANLQVDFLLSPHHGSNTSSQYPFIKSVNGRIVIHSTDRFNRFGFPKLKVQQRYQEMGYQQLSTGCHGMLTINLRTAEIIKMRQQRRIWRFQECTF